MVAGLLQVQEFRGFPPRSSIYLLSSQVYIIPAQKFTTVPLHGCSLLFFLRHARFTLQTHSNIQLGAQITHDGT